jgi:YegS/Rv2252/BmrU family lipid kinase
MTPRACLIFNPSAGPGDPMADLGAIREVLESEIKLDISPVREVSPSQLAFQAIERSPEIIIASGGDGTVSAVAEALMGTEIPLGVIPSGTGNAFARALSIPTDIKDACKTILTGTRRKIDIGLCNSKPMILLSSIGFEAKTMEKTDRRAKKRFGFLAYILAGINQLRHLDCFTADIETGEQTINLRASAITIANAAASISMLAQGPPGVIMDDGLLDVTIVNPANRKNAIFAAYHLLLSGFTGTAPNRDDIQYFRAKSVRVNTKPPQKVALDGSMNGTTPVEVNCIPGGLTVIVPSGWR